MKLVRIEAGKYCPADFPEITIEKWNDGANTYWDCFVDGSVHAMLGTFESLAEMKEELNKYSPEEIIRTCHMKVGEMKRKGA